jgi:hypothetical protein
MLLEFLWSRLYLSMRTHMEEPSKETVIIVHGTWAAPDPAKRRWYQPVEGAPAAEGFVSKSAVRLAEVGTAGEPDLRARKARREIRQGLNRSRPAGSRRCRQCGCRCRCGEEWIRFHDELGV